MKKMLLMLVELLGICFGTGLSVIVWLIVANAINSSETIIWLVAVLLIFVGMPFGYWFTPKIDDMIDKM